MIAFVCSLQASFRTSQLPVVLLLVVCFIQHIPGIVHATTESDTTTAAHSEWLTPTSTQVVHPQDFTALLELHHRRYPNHPDHPYHISPESQRLHALAKQWQCENNHYQEDRMQTHLCTMHRPRLTPLEVQHVYAWIHWSDHTQLSHFCSALQKLPVYRGKLLRKTQMLPKELRLRYMPRFRPGNVIRAAYLNRYGGTKQPRYQGVALSATPEGAPVYKDPFNDWTLVMDVQSARDLSPLAMPLTGEMEVVLPGNVLLRVLGIDEERKYAWFKEVQQKESQ